MGISIQNLKKIYDGRTVVDIEDLHIEKGKIYGIVGPNGAGKSTLLKLVSGLEDPCSGKVKVEDGEITYSNQKPYMYKASVLKNICMPLKFRKTPKNVMLKKAEKIIHEFNLKELIHADATKLSGGEMQKVALARALIFKPEFILLDEPTANIDPEYMEFIENSIIERNKELKTTFIIITHNINQAYRLCHKVIFMDKGKVLGVGDKKEMFKNPKNQVIKKFIDRQLISGFEDL